MLVFRVIAPAGAKMYGQIGYVDYKKDLPKDTVWRHTEESNEKGRYGRANVSDHSSLCLAMFNAFLFAVSVQFRQVGPAHHACGTVGFVI